MQIDVKIIENVFYDVRKKKKNFEKTQIIWKGTFQFPLYT